jgi:hypothetical protein
MGRVSKSRVTAARVGALALVLALALAGCGGDDDDDGGGGGGGGSDDVTGDARTVVRAYFEQVEAGESEKACASYLTKTGISNVYGQTTCDGVVDLVPGPVRIESVEGEGDGASVVVFLSPGTADKRVVTLQQEGGALKIDSIDRP